MYTHECSLLEALKTFYSKNVFTLFWRNICHYFIIDLVWIIVIYFWIIILNHICYLIRVSFLRKVSLGPSVIGSHMKAPYAGTWSTFSSIVRTLTIRQMLFQISSGIDGYHYIIKYIVLGFVYTGENLVLLKNEWYPKNATDIKILIFKFVLLFAYLFVCMSCYIIYSQYCL